MPLLTTANLADPDGFYADLIESQRALSAEDAARMQARLLLLLANQIGDRETLRAAIREAVAGL